MQLSIPSRRGLDLRWVLLPIAFALAGCERQEIQVYEIPKEIPFDYAHAHGHGGSPSMAPEMPRPPALTYDLPEGWTDQSVTSQMQAANISIEGSGSQRAQLTVVPLPDIMNNELQIVNLWRETLGLPPATDADLPSLRQPAEIAGHDGMIYDLAAGASGQAPPGRDRILVAVMTNEGLSWFFKLTGPEEFLGEQADAFRDFLASIEIQDGPETARAPSSTTPPPAMTSTATAPAGNTPDWTVPADWTTQAPGPMLKAEFQTPGNARVTVSSFPGEIMGGLLANVNRWQGQIGLPAVSSGDLSDLVSPMAIDNAEAQLVDLGGGDRERLLVAIVVADGSTWYFKMQGSQDAVEAQKVPFLGFVQSTDFQ